MIEYREELKSLFCVSMILFKLKFVKGYTLYRDVYRLSWINFVLATTLVEQVEKAKGKLINA